jgi:hypothetical protein
LATNRQQQRATIAEDSDNLIAIFSDRKNCKRTKSGKIESNLMTVLTRFSHGALPVAVNV